MTFPGKGVFRGGSDKSSYFGPEFNSQVSYIHFDFRK
jgi:hypothetical protein